MPGTKAEAIKQLKTIPARTREELEFLLDPPADYELGQYEKVVLTRSRADNSKINWGLLGWRYKFHAQYFNFIKQSSEHRKVPKPSAYPYTGEGFLEFVLDVGLPTEEYEHPMIQLKEDAKGFVSGNLHWMDKKEAERVRKENRTSKEKRSLKDRPFIEFQGKKYYETIIQGNIEYVWNAKLGTSGSKFEAGEQVNFLLRFDVWALAHDTNTHGRIIEYIDPEGDLTDPFNMRLKVKEPEHAHADRMNAFRQSTADIIAGLVKVCLGCGVQWRIIEDHVLWVREPLNTRIGPCNKQHTKIKRKKKIWGSPLAVVRAGLSIPHAPILSGKDISSFQSRGERDDDWWEEG
jgi:hypothetical protein